MLLGMFGCILPGEFHWQTFPVRDDYKDQAAQLIANLRQQIAGSDTPDHPLTSTLEAVIAGTHRKTADAINQAMLKGTYTNPVEICAAGYAYFMLTGKKYFTIRATFDNGLITTSCSDSRAKTPSEYNTLFCEESDVKEMIAFQKRHLDAELRKLGIDSESSPTQLTEVEQIQLNVRNAAIVLEANPGHIFVFETAAEAFLAQAMFYPMQQPEVPNCAVVDKGGKYNARVIRKGVKWDIVKVKPRKAR